MAGRRRSDRALRDKLRSPGRPPVAWQEHRRRFWALIAEGLSSEDAAMKVGVSQPVGFRWFRTAGGMAPSHLSRSSKPTSGRYLSFVEREEIALLRAEGLGVREVASRLGRAPSTISRELRRNAATRSGNLDYRATTAQWHAERVSPESSETRDEPGAAILCAGPACGFHSCSWRCCGCRPGGALERSTARATPEPTVGIGMEPTTNRRTVAARLPG